MNKQQIKARILQIINNTIGYIIADEIFINFYKVLILVELKKL